MTTPALSATVLDALKAGWVREQHLLRQRILQHDDVPWSLPVTNAATQGCSDGADAPLCDAKPSLRLVGGLDISFLPSAAAQGPSAATLPTAGPASQAAAQQGPPSPPAHANLSAQAPASSSAQTSSTQDPSEASEGIAALVVLSFPDLSVVYEDYEPLPLSVPYIPGFLAFREVPAYMTLLERVREHKRGMYIPQVVLVDGCGVLHPEGCGSASHLGVLGDIPTVGVAKNLMSVDGLDRRAVEALVETHLSHTGTRNAQTIHTNSSDTQGMQALTGTTTPWQPPPLPPGHVCVPLQGQSGRVWGCALATSNSKKPLYVSVGTRVSLHTAVRLVSLCCKHRIPESIRQADLRSRQAVRDALAARQAAAALVK